MDLLELSPKSERTLQRHKYHYKGFDYLNDFGYPCDYRVLKDGVELGRIKYYRRRRLIEYYVEAEVK